MNTSTKSSLSPRIARIAPVAIATLIAATGFVLAGPLNPPAGAITSTYKTLFEVEPRTAINQTNTPGSADSIFVISQPGSYYLLGNVTGVAGKFGIKILASDVTIDLRGFEMIGVAGSDDGISGDFNSNKRNITIRNGSIRGWGQQAIDLVNTQNLNCIIDGIRASDNVGAGIGVGNGSIVTNCVAMNNGSGAGSYGFRIDGGSSIIGCNATGNVGRGITANTGCTILDCTASQNTFDGIEVTTNCTVRNNNCYFNGNGGSGAGILAGIANGTDGNNRIEGNNCTLADFGILATSTGNFITRNVCSNNTTNWNIAGGNICLVVNGAPTGAFAGNAGGVAPGSLDPNCNFTY